MLADINPGSAASYPGSLTNANGTLFFAANDGVHGYELWALNTAPAPSLAVSGFPATTTAGVAGSFTVVAKNADDSTNTGYTGTVHFTSTDPQAVLPADYSFTAADNGTHTFSAVLKTAGYRSITVNDAQTPSDSGAEWSILVKSAAASTMTVGGFPSTTTAGVAGSVTVTLADLYGNIAAGYAGTVHFTSSDAKAVLPANYTFTAADAGTHLFSATLKTAGTQSITIADTVTASLAGTDGGITVNPGAASQFIITAPSSIKAGVAFSLTITVEDAYGNVVTGYTGTIHFTSTDKTALLPANYTFTAADKGVHVFTGLILRKKGKQKITITDTLNSSLTASLTENVH
jgi:ELWxxDGT repeat protein